MLLPTSDDTAQRKSFVSMLPVLLLTVFVSANFVRPVVFPPRPVLTAAAVSAPQFFPSRGTY